LVPPPQGARPSPLKITISYNAGNTGGAAGGSQRGGPGPSSNIGQVRRGFALPAVEHQPSFGAKQGRFGSGSMVPTTSNADSGMFQRNRNNPGMNRYVAEHHLTISLLQMLIYAVVVHKVVVVVSMRIVSYFQVRLHFLFVVQLKINNSKFFRNCKSNKQIKLVVWN